jgi:hypothetical protein
MHRDGHRIATLANQADVTTLLSHLPVAKFTERVNAIMSRYNWHAARSQRHGSLLAYYSEPPSFISLNPLFFFLFAGGQRLLGIRFGRVNESPQMIDVCFVALIWIATELPLYQMHAFEGRDPSLHRTSRNPHSVSNSLFAGKGRIVGLPPMIGEMKKNIYVDCIEPQVFLPLQNHRRKSEPPRFDERSAPLPFQHSTYLSFLFGRVRLLHGLQSEANRYSLQAQPLQMGRSCRPPPFLMC